LNKEIVKINDVISKTHRPLIQIKSVKGIEQKWLHDNGAGLMHVLKNIYKKQHEI
jgi:hypothetical protein